MPTSATGGIHKLATTRHKMLKIFFIAFMITYSVTNVNPAKARTTPMVDKWAPLPLRLMLRVFNLCHIAFLCFCSWRRCPPDLLCRRQTIT